MLQLQVSMLSPPELVCSVRTQSVFSDIFQFGLTRVKGRLEKCITDVEFLKEFWQVNMSSPPINFILFIHKRRPDAVVSFSLICMRVLSRGTRFWLTLGTALPVDR